MLKLPSQIISGDPWDAQLFILRCEEIVNKIGRKKAAFSAKTLQLHRIFTYIRVIAQTTFVQTKDQYLTTLHNKPIMLNDMELVSKIPEQCFPRSREISSLCKSWSELGLDGPEEDTFDAFYGMPAMILKLIARTTNLIQHLDSSQDHRSSSSRVPANLFHTGAALEKDICAWKIPQRRSKNDGDAAVLVRFGSNDNIHDPTDDMKFNIATAMYHALIIYFFRFVRDTNPIILQHYVESILSNLERHHESKQCFFPGARLGVTVWPSFIAACEALGDGMRHRAISCMRHAAWAGFQNAEAAERVAEEVWRRRDAGEMHVTWMTVLRESETILLLT